MSDGRRDIYNLSTLLKMIRWGNSGVGVQFDFSVTIIIPLYLMSCKCYGVR